MKKRKTCFVITVLLFGLELSGQECTPESLAQTPGTWKQGIAGSTPNVTAAELAKEKAVLASIHKMLVDGYKPKGVEVTYANAFNGPTPYSGKNWIAGSYWYSIYVLQYYCEKNPSAKLKYAPTAATSTTLNIYANVLHESSPIYAAELPDDEMRGYIKLKSRPVKKDGYYFFGEEIAGDSHLPKKIKAYRWLITYNDTLPFSYVTRREYLLLTKKRLEKTIKENGNSSGYYTSFMNSISDWLKKPSAELEKPAICLWNDEEMFNGFVEENTKGSFIAVKPNPAYYKKLPRYVPQFFSVVFKVAEASDVQVSNMTAIQNAVDFSKLKNMLGK